LLLFIKKKKIALRRPAEASQRSGKSLSVAITVLKHLVIARRYDEAISFADSSIEIASADFSSAEAKTVFLRDELTESLG
jgi:hypothetical protein